MNTLGKFTTQNMPHTETKERELIPTGVHTARCYALIDLGTQIVEWEGVEKRQRKVRLTWEIPGEKRVFNEDKGEQPMVISREYTWSFYDNANFRKMLESWVGLKESDIDDFDAGKLVGMPAQIMVMHQESKKGKTYANIASVMPLAKNQACDPQINESMFYHISQGFEDEPFSDLHEFLQNKIKESIEYKVHMGEGWAQGHNYQDPVPPFEGSVDSADDLPF